MLAALDLSTVLQFVLTAIALIAGSLFLVKKAASKYFVVDANFEAGEGYEARHRMSIGGGGGEDGGNGCAACGKSATKKCSRCKSVWYCSQECQTKHWEAEHKLKCKQARLSNKVDVVPSMNGSCRERKASGFGSISLVPARGACKVLQEPKKILFPYDEFVKLYTWDKPGFPPCGLLNCGNSCFANVILQCLSCTRPLVAYLLEKDHSRICIRKREDWCFLCELQLHIKRASQSSQPFSPINILSRLPNIGGNLGYGSQEDAHEFMRCAIDTMQSVCLDEYGGEKALDPSTQETTLIQYIFGGHLQSQVICTKCNTTSNRYENMMDLTVEIHGDAESLEECLDQFTVKEWLDGENMYKCDGCNDYVKAWKQLTVHQAPNILTIALKRFQSGRFGKLNKRVTFPENLDLRPYMSGNGDGGDLYSLYAVVVHLDMLNASFFGHYICYVKDYHGRWYKIDDCKVEIVEVEEVLSQGAYMLLYSRSHARREAFVKPTEPARKKHLASEEVASTIIPKAADPTTVLSTFASNSGLQSDVSLLRDTGHERQLEIKPDALRGKEKADMDLVSRSSTGYGRQSEMKPDALEGKEKEDRDMEVPVEVNPMPAPKDSGNAAMNDIDLCLLGQKELEEKSSSQNSHAPEDAIPINPMESHCGSPTPASSVEVEPMDCDESYGSYAELQMEEDNGSVTVTEEASKFPGCMSDCSPLSTRTFHNLTETSSGASVTSTGASVTSTSVTTPETAGDPISKSEPVMVARHPLGSPNGVHGLTEVCGREDTKALASCLENGYRGKPKPLFSAGFLDRSAGEKSIDHERRRIQAENPRFTALPKENGYSNGFLKADSSGVSLKLGSENGKHTHPHPDMPLVAGGFLKTPYNKPMDEFKVGQNNCNGSVEWAEPSCLGGMTVKKSGIDHAQENGYRVHGKDSAPVSERVDDNGWPDYNSTTMPRLGVQIASGKLEKLNGLVTGSTVENCSNSE